MIDIEALTPHIVEKLKPLNPTKIILFGSYAYGIPTEESDLDLCIIIESIGTKIEKKSKIRNALKDIAIAKDILVESEEYYLSHSDENWINTALYDARHKGTILYEQK
ncbi:MAG: nucleotidyltransferase domain-containing protein [Sulfuricurvum sp.]